MSKKLDLDLTSVTPTGPGAQLELDPYLETMVLVIESKNGLGVQYETRGAAQAARHRFYRARIAAQKAGNRSLDAIVITIEDNTLKLRAVGFGKLFEL